MDHVFILVTRCNEDRSTCGVFTDLEKAKAARVDVNKVVADEASKRYHKYQKHMFPLLHKSEKECVDFDLDLWGVDVYKVPLDKVFGRNEQGILCS